MRKVFCMVMCLCLLLQLMPVHARAEGGEASVTMGGTTTVYGSLDAAVVKLLADFDLVLVFRSLTATVCSPLT